MQDIVFTLILTIILKLIDWIYDRYKKVNQQKENPSSMDLDVTIHFHKGKD